MTDTDRFWQRTRVRVANVSSSKESNMNTGHNNKYAFIKNEYHDNKLNKKYLFQRDVETRGNPTERDDDFVTTACSIGTEKKPFVGHKTLPLLCNWPHYSWVRMNVPEIMHDIKNLCDNLVRLVIGKTGNAADGYSGWSKDAKHRQDCQRLGIFQEVWDGGRLPWRLTKRERLMLDKRASNISWPHYIEPLYYRGASFWRKPNRMWKCRRKYRLLLFFLPVFLRDCVPAIREAILLIASALRRLEGQVYSADVAKSMGILPGSRAIKKDEIAAMHKALLKGLVLLEGCAPIGNLKPSTHHFIHYGAYTKSHGILRLYWMMAFERLV